MVDRRQFIALSGAAAAAGLVSLPAPVAARDLTKLNAALRSFLALPGEKAYLVDVGARGASWRAAHRADAPMFVGSVIKAFILAKVLQDTETGRLSENDEVTIDDGVRSLASPVFLRLRGTTLLRSALEAMITHSDNTGTDVALAAAGPNRVRKLIADAGFTKTLIPQSTRVLFSYVAGAPYRVDAGWDGMKTILGGGLLGRPRSILNDRETMKSTAAEMVEWYQRSLQGEFFQKPATLVEYKRILSMSEAHWLAVPTDTPAYSKAGNIDWQGEHAISIAGQMLLSSVLPVTFSFTVFWKGPDDGVPAVTGDYIASVHDVLHEVQKVFG